MTERRIVDYTIIEHARPARYFVVDVLAAIKSGWELFGPPHTWENVVGQPMVRYAEPDPEAAAEIERLAFELATQVYEARHHYFCSMPMQKTASGILAIKAKREGGGG